MALERVYNAVGWFLDSAVDLIDMVRAPFQKPDEEYKITLQDKSISSTTLTAHKDKPTVISDDKSSITQDELKTCDPSTQLRKKLQDIVNDTKRLLPIRDMFKQYLTRLEKNVEYKAPSFESDVKEDANKFKALSDKLRKLDSSLLKSLFNDLNKEEDYTTMMVCCKKAIEIINLLELGMIEVENYMQSKHTLFSLYDVFNFYLALADVKPITFSLSGSADDAFYMNFFGPEKYPMEHFAYWLKNSFWCEIHTVLSSVSLFLKDEVSRKESSTTTLITTSLGVAPNESIPIVDRKEVTLSSTPTTTALPFSPEPTKSETSAVREKVAEDVSIVQSLKK